jgi:prevent-host-death family protein
MIRINIHEAKANLSRYLKRLKQGETVVICHRNVPVAELRPMPQLDRDPRPVGLHRGKFDLSPLFFEPLPAEVEDAFFGGVA